MLGDESAKLKRVLLVSIVIFWAEGGKWKAMHEEVMESWAYVRKEDGGSSRWVRPKCEHQRPQAGRVANQPVQARSRLRISRLNSSGASISDA